MLERLEELLSSILPGLQHDFAGQLQPGSASVLLQATNHALSAAARYTNKSVDLTVKPKEKKVVIPPDIQFALKQKEAAHKTLLSLSRKESTSESEIMVAEQTFKSTKATYKIFVRKHKISQDQGQKLAPNI